MKKVITQELQKKIHKRIHGTSEENIQETTKKEPKTSVSEEKVETQRTVTKINSIIASVTKANVWVINQNTEYEKKDNPEETPLGVDGITTQLDDEPEPEGDTGEWKIDRSETTKETVKKEEWKVAKHKIDINESQFLGLWRNEYGEYKEQAPYVTEEDGGKEVFYKTPPSKNKKEAPIGNILNAEDWLYTLLERSETTQTHARIMKYLINFYKTGERADISDILSLFDITEFTQTDWTKFGTGYWWPLEDTMQTNITSGFGYRGDIGVEGASTYHKGIDIGVPIGSKVIASADGTVEVAGDSASAGNWIRINHGNGVKTVYMHNSRLLVSVGQVVKQGDVIAMSGNTGISGGPHLHFGVMLNGEYVDPLDYVDPGNPRPTNTPPDVPANVEAWGIYIKQAFEELGYEYTEEKMGAILRQISTESGGNQFIIQGIEDSNSGKTINIGDGTCPWCPSEQGGSCGNTNIGHGLLQFIPTTFYANMIPGHTNIFNGYDQICACITMLEKRPGSYTQYIGNGTGWG